MRPIRFPLTASLFSWKIFWNAEYRLALRNIMESPSDKCEGFDNSLRRIKQLKHHISKYFQISHRGWSQPSLNTPRWKSLPLDSSQMSGRGITNIKLVFWIALPALTVNTANTKISNSSNHSFLYTDHIHFESYTQYCCHESWCVSLSLGLWVVWDDHRNSLTLTLSFGFLSFLESSKSDLVNWLISTLSLA